jgi:class 3 adenylate cyclase
VRSAAEDSVAQAFDGERKTVTALFADIKGSMDIMEDLDPEQARAIVDPALKLMIDAVQRYDGYIVQSTGDGIFALFGAPVAHEDHPQRALYAALRMQEDMRRYSAKLRGAGSLPIEARIGVNTGEVVVRSIATGGGHEEYTPVGHSTGLAARMQALAPTGSVAATEQVRKLCEGYFLFKDLGPASVKGVAGQVNVFEVVGLGPLRTRLQVAARRGLTKFVGRQAELDQMKRVLGLASAGHGQIVAAIGEPGVGKSRLFFEFKAIAQAGCLVLEAYSVSHGKASAYLPVIDLLRNYFGVVTEDDERKRREKVNGKIITLDRALDDTLPYMFALLGIVEGNDPLEQLDAQLRRRRTMEAIKRILGRESINQPLIVVFEDLHWIDNETQELLNLMVDALATSRILLLVNYRPEYHHQWGNKTYYTQLRLDPLGRESAEEMLAVLLAAPGSAEASADGLTALKYLIVERTEGNPFFMEEIIQSLFEQGVLVRNGSVRLTKSIEEIRVPNAVQAILTSRIDRLGAEEKALLQTLAVLGREFPLSLIRCMTAKPEAELERMLSELQLGEFIYEQPATGDVEYIFKHALTLEVAYNSVLVQRRRLLHERVAIALEALFAERLEDHLAELAHHYERSGNARKAVEYLGRAGHRAAQQVAHAEAASYFTRALELLGRLPEGFDRDRQELDLQMALGTSLFAIKGAGAAEREVTLLRAIQLAEQLGDNAKLMEALLALGFFHEWRSAYDTVEKIAGRVLALAEAAQAPEMLARGHSQLGWALMFTGHLLRAREHFELAVDLFESVPASKMGGLHYYEMAGAVDGLSAVLRWLGYPATAHRKSRELLETVRRLSDPVLLASVLVRNTIGNIMLRLRGNQSVADQIEELDAIASEYGIAFRRIQAGFFRAWFAATARNDRKGIAEMRRALSESTTFRVGISAMRELTLAQASYDLGMAQEGLEAVGKGLASVDADGFFAGELTRLKGELLLLRNPSAAADAERCLRRSLEIARAKGAKLCELRTTTSLARLFSGQGKGEEARKSLSEIYNWFTEGFDTPDLKDAKALLDELSA